MNPTLALGGLQAPPFGHRPKAYQNDRTFPDHAARALPGSPTGATQPPTREALPDRDTRRGLG